MLLPALLVLPVPGTAHAAGTYRFDDGTPETELLVDASDGKDTAWIWFTLPYGEPHGSTGATLWVYGRAIHCGVAGTQRLVTHRGVVATFDPCTTFPTTGYGWHAFTVPIELIDRGTAWFSIEDDGALPGSDAAYAVDTSVWSSGIREHDLTGTRQLDAALMWYLDLTGSVPHMAGGWYVQDYGTVAPGGSSGEQGIGVMNDGLQPLTPSYSVSSPEFVVTTDHCSGNTFATGTGCAIWLEFRPTSPGTKIATVTFTAPGAAPWSATIFGGGAVPAPVATMATPDDTVLVPPDGVVTGSVTGVARVVQVFAKFNGYSIAAELSCDDAQTFCTWTARPFQESPNDSEWVPGGVYTVRAYGVDGQGNVGASTAPITVVVPPYSYQY